MSRVLSFGDILFPYLVIYRLNFIEQSLGAEHFGVILLEVDALVVE